MVAFRRRAPLPDIEEPGLSLLEPQTDLFDGQSEFVGDQLGGLRLSQDIVAVEEGRIVEGIVTAENGELLGGEGFLNFLASPQIKCTVSLGSFIGESDVKAPSGRSQIAQDKAEGLLGGSSIACLVGMAIGGGEEFREEQIVDEAFLEVGETPFAVAAMGKESSAEMVEKASVKQGVESSDDSRIGRRGLCPFEREGGEESIGSGDLRSLRPPREKPGEVVVKV